MGRVRFCGVGEFFDERLPNTCLHVEFGARLLLDCGFTAAAAYWRVAPDPLGLDGVYISHFHGDHFLGLPALLLRMHQEGRGEPLAILGQPGLADKIGQALDLAFAKSPADLRFAVRCIEVQAGQELDFHGLRLRFALGHHSPSAPSLAIRIDAPGEGPSVFYSGDGRPTPETQALAHGCDLVVHEAFSLEPQEETHSSVTMSLDFARRARVKALALVHMRRDVRRDHDAEVRRVLARETSLHAFLPEPGDEWPVDGDLG